MKDVPATSGRRNRLLAATFLCSVSSMAATPARAVPIDAGDYVPAPPGTNLALLYMQYAHADALYADGHRIDGNARLDSEIGILRYVGFGKIGGMTFDYQVLQPFGRLDAGGSTKSLGHASGFGDTILVSTFWLVNDPARKRYFGVTPYLYLPTGDYDRTRALNLGEHRWKGAMQAVYSQGFGDHFIGELSGDVTVYGHNDAMTTGPKTQKPMVQLQGFSRYVIDPKDELNVRITYTTGGKTTLDGLDQNDRTNSWAMLGTYRRSIGKRQQVMLQGGTDLAVRDGFREGLRLQMRLLQVF